LPSFKEISASTGKLAKEPKGKKPTQLRTYRTFLLLAIVWACFWLTPISSLAMPVLELKMRHQGVGRCNVFVAKQAIRMVSLENKYEMVAHAPDWRVTSFNQTTRVINEMSLKDWCGFVSQLSDGWAFKTAPDTLQQRTIFAGVPARRCVTPLNGRWLGWPKGFGSKSFAAEELFFYQGSDVSAPSAKLINQLFDAEGESDLVLGCAFIRPNGSKFRQIWTYMTSTIDVPPKFFDAPQGMKKAPLGQIFGNCTAVPADIKEMIDGVGLGENLGPANSKTAK